MEGRKDLNEGGERTGVPEGRMDLNRDRVEGVLGRRKDLIRDRERTGVPEGRKDLTRDRERTRLRVGGREERKVERERLGAASLRAMLSGGLRQASTERRASPQVASQSGETRRAPSSSGSHSSAKTTSWSREEAERARSDAEEGGWRKGFL